MEIKELYKLLKTIKIPIAYDHFEDSKNLTPPFMAYREQGQNSFSADNENYNNVPNFEIELVTIKKDIELENKIEKLFIDNNIPYEKNNEVWDNDEKIYHIFYEI